MLHEEMIAACMTGVRLPPLTEDGGAPLLIPDAAEVNGPGVVLTKSARRLFLWIVETPMTEEQFVEESSEMLKAKMSGVVVVARNTEELCETGERRWLYNPRLHAPAQPVSVAPALPTEPALPDLIAKTDVQMSGRASADAGDVSMPSPLPESLKSNVDSVAAPPSKARPVISMSSETWKRVEEGRTLIAPGESLREVATRVMGAEAAGVWMERRLMTLGGESPASASLRSEGLAACLKLLTKFPLATPPLDVPASA